MHISRVHIRAFKRFHDLTIEIPGTPRLVIMCGPNGIGKSSVIDALRLWHGGHGSPEGWAFEELYHRKTGEDHISVGELVSVTFAEPTATDPRKLIYARSAYRHEPDFQTSSVSRRGEVFGAPRANRMIDPETKVSDNYQRLVSATLDEIYSGRYDADSVGSLRDRHIGRIRDVMLKLFPDLELMGPGDPVGGGTFLFSKNGRPEFHYKNLSGGEKAAFDLVLDLTIKTLAYDDTIVAIDEPELHMNSRLQAALLDQLLALIPPSGQLWLATHSIGMMRRAHELWMASPDDVAFLDFEGNDFDAPVAIAPTRPNRDFWARVLSVALGDMAGLVAPDHVVMCEGRVASAINPARAEFDARCYRRIFRSELPLVDFVSVGNSADVANDRLEIGRTIQAVVSGTRVTRVVDRDLRTAQEIQDLQATGTRVLSRRHIEAYLLDDEVLAAFCASLGRPSDTAATIAIRDAALAESVSRGHDVDDLKSAAPQFYANVRRSLSITSPGSTVEAFLADILAELLQPGMAAYDQLKRDIFGCSVPSRRRPFTNA
jgi:hypothetical protein